jgi:hypothetical protein
MKQRLALLMNLGNTTLPARSTGLNPDSRPIRAFYLLILHSSLLVVSALQIG